MTWDEIVEIAHEAYCLAKSEGARGDGAMRAALRTLIAAGYAIVPREATEEMIEALECAWSSEEAARNLIDAGEIAPKDGEADPDAGLPTHEDVRGILKDPSP